MQTIFQIIGKMNRLAFIPVVLSVIIALFYFILWISDFQGNELTVSLSGMIALTCFIWVVGGIGSFRQAGIYIAKASPSPLPEMLAFALPIIPLTILGYLVNWGNQLLIQANFSSRDVGLYYSAFQVHSWIVAVALPLTTIILPRLIGRYYEDTTVMKRYVAGVVPTLFSLWLLVIIPVVAIFPFFFKVVFGRSFIEGELLLKIFLIGTPLCGLGQLYTVLFPVQKKMGQLFYVLLGMAVINFTVVFMLLQRYGIQAAAFAFSLAFIVSQYLMFFIQHRYLKQSKSKIHLLIVACLVFSIGQNFFQDLPLRIFWGAFAFVMLVLLERHFQTVDENLLLDIFSGELEYLGRQIRRLLVKKMPVEQ